MRVHIVVVVMVDLLRRYGFLLEGNHMDELVHSCFLCGDGDGGK
jgi:hypothetical protein